MLTKRGKLVQRPALLDQVFQVQNTNMGADGQGGRGWETDDV